MKYLHKRYLSLYRFIAILSFFFLANLPDLFNSMKTATKEQKPISETINNLETSYNDNFSFKTKFVSLNGAVHRLLGQRDMNYITRLNNGRLVWVREEIFDLPTKAKKFLICGIL